MAEELATCEPQATAVEVPLLRIEAVVKNFGALRAVDRLSLQIRAGEFFALLGPAAAARPRCCGCWPVSRPRTRAASCSMARHRAGVAARPAGQHDVPELRAVSPSQRARQYRLRPEARANATPAIEARVAELSRWSGSRVWRSAGPTSSPAARSSAWRWRVRWRAARSCCCSTNRWPRSTRSCAKAPSSN